MKGHANTQSKKRAMWPVMRERITLDDSMASYMCMLGLKRIPKDIGSLPVEWTERVKPYEEDEAPVGNEVSNPKPQRESAE